MNNVTINTAVKIQITCMEPTYNRNPWQQTLLLRHDSERSSSRLARPPGCGVRPGLERSHRLLDFGRWRRRVGHVEAWRRKRHSIGPPHLSVLCIDDLGGHGRRGKCNRRIVHACSGKPSHFARSQGPRVFLVRRRRQSPLEWRWPRPLVPLGVEHRRPNRDAPMAHRPGQGPTHHSTPFRRDGLRQCRKLDGDQPQFRTCTSCSCPQPQLLLGTALGLQAIRPQWWAGRTIEGPSRGRRSCGAGCPPERGLPRCGSGQRPLDMWARPGCQSMGLVDA